MLRSQWLRQLKLLLLFILNLVNYSFIITRTFYHVCFLIKKTLRFKFNKKYFDITKIIKVFIIILTYAIIYAPVVTSSTFILYPAYNLNINKHTSQFRNSLTLRLAIIWQYIDIRFGFEIIFESISQYVFEKSIPVDLYQRFFVIDFIEERRFILILLSLIGSPFIMSFGDFCHWSLNNLLFFWSLGANCTISYLWSWNIGVIVCMGF